MPEKFNPHNPEYKKVEDLPRAFKDDFVDTEDGTGFVRKEADALFTDAQRKADKNLKLGKLENISPQDILHGKGVTPGEMLMRAEGALKDEARREEAIAKAVKNKYFDGTDLGRGGSGDVIQKAFNAGEIDRAFFMRLAQGGVRIFWGALPQELTDDEGLLLELASKTPTSMEMLSPRLREDPEFILKLVQAGGNFEDEDCQKMLEKVFANREQVLSYLRGVTIEKIEQQRGEDGVFRFLAQRYPNDNEILGLLIEKNPKTLMHAEDSLATATQRAFARKILAGMPHDKVAKIIEYIDRIDKDESS